MCSVSRAVPELLSRGSFLLNSAAQLRKEVVSMGDTVGKTEEWKEKKTKQRKETTKNKARSPHESCKESSGYRMTKVVVVVSKVEQQENRSQGQGQGQNRTGQRKGRLRLPMPAMPAMHLGPWMGGDCGGSCTPGCVAV